ncbi:phage tail protein, partial [Acinetobacter baumannii]
VLAAPSSHEIYYRVRHSNVNSGAYSLYKMWTQKNTTVDGNGFIKSASPVVKLFNDHIELNSDAEKQPIEFKKVDVGDYL